MLSAEDDTRMTTPYARDISRSAYADRLVFVGVQEEYQEFRARCPRCTNFYEAPNLLELARPGGLQVLRRQPGTAVYTPSHDPHFSRYFA
jgi:hypothetical protein